MPSLRFVTTLPDHPRRVRLFKRLTTLGRESDCDIPIRHPSVEPAHAIITFDGQTYEIKASGKKTPFLLNGRKERMATLAHEDVITLGEVDLSFDLLENEGRAEENRDAQFAWLHKLYEFTEKLMNVRDLDELLNTMMDLVIEATGATNGFLILRREDLKLHVTVARNLNRESIDNAISYVSDSIIKHVVSTRRPVIVSDALNDDAFRNAASVINLKLTSVLCVPLIARGNLLGILYLGNNSVINLFTPDKLQILEIFAGQASLLIQNALLVNELTLDRKELKERIEEMRGGSMIGASEGMREVFRKLEKVAHTDVPVLLLGETGTGKELVAREVHERSPRREGPFVVINCGAIPRELLESELFGHLKGSFTGAVANYPGKFRAAHGGTLFLDEIGDMPIGLQVKLLRAIEERRVVSVGDTQPEDVDIRIVAATNKSLERAIREGEFREDLFYRLNVITIHIPPLRERGDDRVMIAKYFLSRFAWEYDRKIKGFSPRSLEAIAHYDWPGNVRELQNRIKKSVIMAERNLIEPEDLGLNEVRPRAVKPLALAREEFTMAYIRDVLRQFEGNRTRTAQVLDVDPRTIFRYLEKMDGEEG